jgi:adenine-specific DNA-methyltransferase
MNQKKQRLELTWIGKENRPRLEPRILLEDPEKSYHAKHRIKDSDLFDNRLIFGDNLLALKALEQEFTGKIKCIYIDPPFNTQQAFEHYDDGVEHSVWLSLMRDRLELLCKLLHPAGSLFIHIDDTELGYLIAIADEIFDRKNRASVITFKQSSASGPKAVNPGLVTTTNFILYYAKDKELWQSFKVFVPTGRDDRYSKVIENYQAPFSTWKLVNLKDAFCSHHRATWNDLKVRFTDKLESRIEEFVLANAERVVRTARVASKDVNEEARGALAKSVETPGVVFRSERLDKEDYYFLNSEQLLFYRTKARIIDGKLTTAAAATNIWDDILSNNLHNEGGVAFPNGKKPEFLLKRILELSTEPGDLVLDSFAGSGTTGAVAHKMGRRWIMVELEETCHTHIIPRLRKVINGADPAGVTEAVRWKGGGGFRYYRLAPSLLEKDKWGQWVISKKFNAAMLAEAVCKLEGFQYSPSDTLYWQHGYSTERDFIYVTTQHLSADQLAQLSDEVGPERTLLVLCAAFRVPRGAGAERYPNLTVKKIPKQVLSRCEWGHDDYSLKVENLRKAPPPPPKADKRGQQSLFGEEVGK